jgi:curved DNA-binding protein CbpA
VLNHYDVLSVDPNAEMETIRRAWRLKIRLLHPDRHRDSPQDVQAEAARETLRVNKAWDTLRDPEKRHEYDVYLLQLHGAALERQQDPDDSSGGRAGDEPAPAWPEWLSPLTYLNAASFLIVVIGACFVIAGAVLLARMTA